MRISKYGEASSNNLTRQRLGTHLSRHWRWGAVVLLTTNSFLWIAAVVLVTGSYEPHFVYPYTHGAHHSLCVAPCKPPFRHARNVRSSVIIYKSWDEDVCHIIAPPPSHVIIAVVKKKTFFQHFKSFTCRNFEGKTQQFFIWMLIYASINSSSLFFSISYCCDVPVDFF